jgi:hypothetical protein
MDKFTFEELCLMRIFDTTSRDTLRGELVTALHDIDDNAEPDLLPLFGTTLEKLDNLTHEEFTALAVYLGVEDFYAEDEEAEL